jgi:hypothetical protein
MAPARLLLSKRLIIAGWPSGVASDSQDNVNFSTLTGVRPRYGLLRRAGPGEPPPRYGGCGGKNQKAESPRPRSAP